jgi:hypothetical protein
MTKLAAKMVYGESRCRDRYAFNVAALESFGSTYKVSMADWRPGGRFRNLLEADIEVLKAEHGSLSNSLSFKFGTPKQLAAQEPERTKPSVLQRLLCEALLEIKRLNWISRILHSKSLGYEVEL